MEPFLIQDKTREKDFEQKIAYLTLNASFAPNLGLLHGKMGYVLFFAYYGRIMKNVLYEDLASELLDEILEELHEDWALSLENGLCGIGWGIEYLIQQGFMEGDTDEILKAIDHRIMEWDPRRIKDLSLRKGIGGILYYVAMRLSSLRPTTCKPFDSIYLHDLLEAILENDFSTQKDLPTGLLNDLIHILKEERNDISPISDYLLKMVLDSCLNIPIKWEINSSLALRDPLGKCLSNEKRLYLIKDENPSGNYGVGTYINQICEAMRKSEWKVIIVTLRSSRTSTVSIEKKENLFYLDLGNIKKVYGNLDWRKYNKRYYRNALILLQSFCMGNSERSVFHLNNMHMADLALGLKAIYPLSKVIGTVHYMDWSLALLGNKSKLEEIRDHPQEKRNQSILNSIEENKRFLHACDVVVAISGHSYRGITEIADIPAIKIEMIPHGIKDIYQPLSKEEKNQLRQQYGFASEDRILVYAGRLDPLKGIDSLAVAFESLSIRYPNLRLILAGSGDYRLVHEKIKYSGSKITFTGLVDKKTLYDLYSIADIGIFPSLYEELGYVALEMMMMSLPVIAGNNSGLKEVVGEDKNGILVPLHCCYGKVEENALFLEKAIVQLISSLSLQREIARNGRKRYQSYFDLDHFYSAYIRILTNKSV